MGMVAYSRLSVRKRDSAQLDGPLGSRFAMANPRTILRISRRVPVYPFVAGGAAASVFKLQYNNRRRFLDAPMTAPRLPIQRRVECNRDRAEHDSVDGECGAEPHGR